MAEGQHTGRQIRRKGQAGYYVLGDVISNGGEGEIYAVTNDAAKVAKVYLPGKGSNGVKLPAMEGKCPTSAGTTGHPPIAWPEQTIIDSATNAPVGFIMPKVDTARTMLFGEFIYPDTRQQKLQAMGLQMDGVQIQETKWRIIENLASIAASIHRHGHAIGDVNERNILVEPGHGYVSIVDSDSFQIRDRTNKIIYRCRVGCPGYTAPELLRQMQGTCRQPKCIGGEPGKHQVGYPCVPRNESHDMFGLAVLAFQLLMDGAHPYDCAITGPMSQDESLNQRRAKMERDYFPYSRRRPPHIHVRDGECETRYRRLPENVKAKFERAFGPM